MTLDVAICVAVTAFIWAGGADVPDTSYDWKGVIVSLSDYSTTEAVDQCAFRSRNECEVNIKHQVPPDNSYFACQPLLK